MDRLSIPELEMSAISSHSSVRGGNQLGCTLSPYSETIYVRKRAVLAQLFNSEKLTFISKFGMKLQRVRSADREASSICSTQPGISAVCLAKRYGYGEKSSPKNSKLRYATGFRTSNQTER
ncbi:MAG: hypothetical protein K6G78_02145 [bacterium]|nr:hypothetical protein [bacterium]